MEKEKRIVFVIMPFSKTPTRSKADLDEFYHTNLKARIESEISFEYAYVVKRSDDRFDITAEIIRDLYEADIVLCDLSGETANPNVMYELGVRFSVSAKPTILFREAHPDNQRIFDVAGFYTEEYSPTRYRQLEEYVIGKIKKFETGEERFQSPVLKTLETEPSIIQDISRIDTVAILNAMQAALNGLALQFGGAILTQAATQDIDVDDIHEESVVALVRRDEFKSVRWQDLQFEPNCPPALFTWLSGTKLRGMVSFDIENRVNSYLSQFYTTFFSVGRLWTAAGRDFYEVFAIETERAMLLCQNLALVVGNSAGFTAINTLKSISEMIEDSVWKVGKGHETKYTD